MAGGSGSLNVCTALKIQPAELKPAAPTLPLLGNYGSYTCDSILGEEASQTDVYEEFVRPYVDAFLEVAPLAASACNGTPPHAAMRHWQSCARAS